MSESASSEVQSESEAEPDSDSFNLRCRLDMVGDRGGIRGSGVGADQQWMTKWGKKRGNNKKGKARSQLNI